MSGPRRPRRIYAKMVRLGRRIDGREEDRGHRGRAVEHRNEVDQARLTGHDTAHARKDDLPSRKTRPAANTEKGPDAVLVVGEQVRLPRSHPPSRSPLKRPSLRRCALR